MQPVFGPSLKSYNNFKKGLSKGIALGALFAKANRC